ncbi:FliM/FliN family flagellar motor switch protein [Acidobacteriota bacterium]
MANGGKAGRRKTGETSVPMDIFKDVPIELSVEMGRSTLKVESLLRLTPGSIILLDRFVGEPLELLANGVPIARGEIVLQGSRLQYRVGEVHRPWETN